MTKELSGGIVAKSKAKNLLSIEEEKENKTKKQEKQSNIIN